MKAFKDLFGDTCGADYAMAAAIVITFATIAAERAFAVDIRVSGIATLWSARLEDYRGPRA